MCSLEEIQCFFKEKERQEKHEALQLLEACESMRRYKGNKRAVKAFLQMAVHFYGKEQITATIKNYGFERLKKYMR